VEKFYSGKTISLVIGYSAGGGYDTYARLVARFMGEHIPNLLDVPLLMDLATNQEDRILLRLLSAPATVGRPIFTTPSTPIPRVQALRAAFETMIADRAFITAAKAADLEVNAVSGEELQKIVAEIVATPGLITMRLAEIIAEGTEKKN
jgi:tripartite-type tricarboxylate transporter receptor subunit TctC